jgi:hypothetical protein
MIQPVLEGKLTRKAKAWWMKKKIDFKLKHGTRLNHLINRYKSPAVQERIKEARSHALEMLGGL